MCFTTEVWIKRCFPFINGLLLPLPAQYDVENQKKIAGSSFNIAGGWGGGGGGVRQVKCIVVWRKKRKSAKSANLSQVQVLEHTSISIRTYKY